MQKMLLSALLACTPLTQGCSNSNIQPFEETRGAVSKLLSRPAYTVRDDQILNRSGDSAAAAVMKDVPFQEMTSPEKRRQILLILRLAFEAPQLIVERIDRTPTAAMLLLNKLERTELGQRTAINNVRFEIKHNTSTGRPLETVSLPGEPIVDWEHTQWVGSVLAWTADIKPGMTREDLLRVFTTEGGLSTRTQQTYVLKGCPYIHVDVEFSPVRGLLASERNDKIARISKPYLDEGHID